MSNHDAWYLMKDGTHADPDSVSPGKDGILRTKSGMEVVYRESGVPHTVGRDAAENKNIQAAKVGKSDLAPPDVPLAELPDVPAVPAADAKGPVEPLKTTDLAPKAAEAPKVEAPKAAPAPAPAAKK